MAIGILPPNPGNLAPGSFFFWQPPPGSVIEVGAANLPVELPDYPLPVPLVTSVEAVPTPDQIGQGVYDYLRRFPDCPGNTLYAELLRNAFPHYLSDLAAHAVMLDAKDVEAAYVLRKLTCLKILHLAEPGNAGVLRQLSRGYFDLAFDFAELTACRHHLLEAMRFGQELRKLIPDDPQALALLGEIDFMFGDAPAARSKWQKLLTVLDDPAGQVRIAARLAALPTEVAAEEFALVDELEGVAEAMRLHAASNHRAAVALLERIEEQGQLVRALPSADFYRLLGTCRLGCGDHRGALLALHRALELEPGHPVASAALAEIQELPWTT